MPGHQRGIQCAQKESPWVQDEVAKKNTLLQTQCQEAEIQRALLLAAEKRLETAVWLEREKIKKLQEEFAEVTLYWEHLHSTGKVQDEQGSMLP